MFGFDSHQPLPPDIQTSYAAWDAYMGHLWHQLFHFLKIHQHATLIEIGPGASTKIPRALSQLNFRGQLHVVEPHYDLYQQLEAKYQLLLPHAQLYFYNHTMQTALLTLPRKPQGVFANHVLDDMLLMEENMQNIGQFHWALQVTPVSNGAITQAEFKKLTDTPDRLRIRMDGVIACWRALIDILHPRRLVLSQYPSYTLEQFKLHDLHQCAWRILENIRKRYPEQCVSSIMLQKVLNQLPHYNHPHIGLNVLDARHWLVLQTSKIGNSCNRPKV